MGIERFETTTFLVTCAAGWEAKAKEEVRRAIPDAHARSLFLRGTLLVTCETPQEVAVAALAEAETQTVGRIFPLHVRCDVGKGPEHLETLALASDLLPGPDPAFTFWAECERRGAHEWTSQQVAILVGDRVGDRTGSPGEFGTPDQVVTIQVFQDIAFLGVGWADEFLRKEITRMRKYAPGQRPLNRAEPKLREILSGFGIELSPEARALDVGSSPGGWAKVLAERCAEVVAVDPGELDPRVLALPNVVHLRERSEALIGRAELGMFDIITNDMNMDPGLSAGILCELAPLVVPSGVCVMTVKFVTRHRRELVQAALDVLEECYADPRVGRVAHNAHETTIVATRR
jgi:tRNA acetyltransferase TAN1